jgi:hypothetical protein
MEYPRRNWVYSLAGNASERWIYVHIIREHARHARLASARELMTGRTGEAERDRILALL